MRQSAARFGGYWAVGLALAYAMCFEGARGQLTPEYELPPIEYSRTAGSNRVTRLQERIKAGEIPPAGTEIERLKTLLAALEIPVESQTLVFSRTSLQRDRISPSQPRAVYFSDDVYFGWVPGGLMEAAVSDPKLGIAFYRLDPRGPFESIQFTRDAECLSCHGGSMTRQWPGLMVRSVRADRRGDPILSAGTFLTGHESPLKERWGGWYVTDATGGDDEVVHMGNTFSESTGDGGALDRAEGANLQDLSAFFDPGKYPRAGSDIVALMTLEHQVNMHNRLARAALRVRKWSLYQRNLQKELGEPEAEELSGVALRVVESETERIVEYLLFCDEAELPPSGLSGDPAFQEAFRRNRIEDAQGRSLKDFHLKNRLFRYRCSYMIYSDAFDALPETLRASVYARLLEILDAEEAPSRYGHLTHRERQALMEILKGTKPELAAEWARLQAKGGAERTVAIRPVRALEGGN